MKKIHLYILSTVMIIISSCASVSSFDTPNSIRNIYGTLHLTNGKSVDGKLVINREGFSGRTVKIFVDNERRPMQFNILEVEGYETRGNYFELKQLKGGLNLGREFSFMKRLTGEGSRIHLYEDLQKETTTSNNVTSTKYETQYYMQFPKEDGDEVWPLNSKKFVPNFDEKMSRIVADCPSLAEKIARKENGYFYAQVSLFKERRAEVLLHIIDEYNQCK